MNNKQPGNHSVVDILKQDWLLLLLILAALAGGIYVYPVLPDEIPIHWNWRGEVDGTMAKPLGVFMQPVITLILYLLMVALPAIDPNRANYAKFTKAYAWFRWAFVLFMLTLNLSSLITAMGYPLDISLVVRAGIAILFMVIGNFMGKIQPNYFIGIRTPWTLADPEVWRKVHRHSGVLWFIAGIAILFGLLFPPTIGTLIFWAATLFAGFYPLVHAYWVYRRIHGK